MSNNTDATADRVAWADACPRCGEDRLDLLVWLGDDATEVKCETCGRVYSPFDKGLPALRRAEGKGEDSTT